MIGFFFFEKSLVNFETPGHTQQLSAGKQRRKNHDSLNLVHCCWVDRGDHREIGDARAHDDFLDNRARHHRVDHRRRGYPHVFGPDNRRIASSRPDFFHTWRDPGSLRLHQAEYPFPPRSLIKEEETVAVVVDRGLSVERRPQPSTLNHQLSTSFVRPFAAALFKPDKPCVSRHRASLPTSHRSGISLADPLRSQPHKPYVSLLPIIYGFRAILMTDGTDRF